MRRDQSETGTVAVPTTRDEFPTSKTNKEDAEGVWNNLFGTLSKETSSNSFLFYVSSPGQMCVWGIFLQIEKTPR